MRLEIKERFLKAWEKHFPNNELPLVCFYANELKDVEFPNAPKPHPRGYTCIFSQIAPVRRGRARAFNADNLGCFGANLHLGFDQPHVTDEVRQYVCEVERYKKTSDHLDRHYAHYPIMQAPGKYLVFKRWDILEEHDTPQVVVFFGNPDTMSGLHTLANYDEKTPFGVYAAWGSGCDSLINYPMRELESEQPKSFIGGFDPSGRRCVKPDLLTFSTPWPKFLRMLDNMDESFLVGDDWADVKSRFQSRK